MRSAQTKLNNHPEKQDHSAAHDNNTRKAKSLPAVFSMVQMQKEIPVKDDQGLEHKKAIGAGQMSTGLMSASATAFRNSAAKNPVQFWNPVSVNKILSQDAEAKEKVLPNLNKLNVFSKFNTASFQTEDQPGLGGITFNKQKQIYINDGLSNKEAASTIYHEFHHTMHATPDVKSNKNKKKKQKADLRNEVDTWVREYEFRIRQDLITERDIESGFVKEIALEQGKKAYQVDKKQIRNEIMGGYEEDYSSGKRSDRFNPANWVFGGPVNLLTWNWDR